MKELFESLGTKVCLTEDFSELSFKVGTYGADVLWVCDSNTARMVRPLPEPNIILAAGESSKNWQSVERILYAASGAKLSRKSNFIALGGGVISDVTAFAASVYQRGSRLVLIPTTLLSMVDASLGGKTGINFNNAKNQIGTFYPANEVILCIDCIKSLPQKEYVNGLAEVLKHCFLSEDQTLYELMKNNMQEVLEKDKDLLTQIVEKSLLTKKSYIENDPMEENGIRSALNLGHTFGHALESLTHMQWSHGEAIAWGTCIATSIGSELGLCSNEFREKVIGLFDDYGYKVNYRIDRGDWLTFSSYLAKDKKRLDGKIKYVIPESFGKTTMLNLDDELVRKHVIKPSF